MFVGSDLLTMWVGDYPQRINLMYNLKLTIMIYKLIEKIDDKKNRELKLDVYYEKGFYNGWTSQDVKRGVKLIVTCVTVEDRGSYKMEQIDVFGKGNFSMHLESLARKSAKKLEYWENKVKEKSDELFEAWMAGLYSKFFEILGV